MPYSCIVRPYVDIKHTFYQQCNRKRLKFNIMYAVSNPLFYCISWPLAVAENRIWAGLRKAFLQSMVNRLSADALFVHCYAVCGHKTQVFSAG